MQFIKSLLCWQGFDNRKRFIIISMASFITFVLLNQGLSDHKLSATGVLLICSVICLASTRRRVNDAQIDKKWLLAPTGSFLIAGLVVIFIAVSHWLLIIALVVSLLLLTYPSKNPRRFILGYAGPVDLAQFTASEKVKVRNNSRVEPTLNSINIADTPINKGYHTADGNSVHNSASTRPTLQSDNNISGNNVSDNTDIGETIRLILFSRKNMRITIVLASLLLVIILLLSVSLSAPASKRLPQTEESVIEQPKNNFQHSITLPDNFSLMISDDKGLVIQWQTNVADNSEVWSLATAVGDKGCESVAFDKKTTIRTYRVSAVDGEYYAYFSPLDTKTLIKSIAFKNKFALCGYNFSLKGSQAVLGKSSFYANLLEY